MPGIDDLLAAGKFFGKLALGDKDGAASVLRGEADAPVTCDGCKANSHKQGDAACSARDGRFHCIGHGPEGSCIMSEEPQK